MNESEIDTSKPSRKLDAVVAEKVMGWTEVEFNKDTGKWAGRDPKGKYRALFWFSGNVEFAWKIAEKYRLCVTPYGDNQWTAFEQHEWDTQAGLNAAETMPLALCKCGLRINAEALARGE
jgi:hypothetical protein